ncbi:unnamed protein product [Prunus armeniaca]|uniref:NAD(P)-binding domain-containing protein n=1 Tax=Prunus armeniaca TaxID=36596 RepID=A0A6J5UCT0_PRUAR|nr:unnamed protein product [Prunus armeniaca]
MPADSSSVSGHGQTVCVTGAGGFIASWIVKLLLERGYIVRGTLRNPDDPKNAHLRELEVAQDRLTLRKADLLDFESLKEAINGCDGVFHTASPVTDDPNWYCYAKTVAEQTAWEEAKEKGVDLVVVNPVLVLGPLLQPTVNASIIHILKYLTGSAKTYANSVQAYVHVRDVALAHIMVYETPSASGRYLCGESVLHRGDVVEILAKLFPEYPIPTKCSDEVKPRVKPYKLTTQKLQDLGVEFTPVKQCLYETVKSLQEKGHLPVPKPQENALSTIFDKTFGKMNSNLTNIINIIQSLSLSSTANDLIRENILKKTEKQDLFDEDEQSNELPQVTSKGSGQPMSIVNVHHDSSATPTIVKNGTNYSVWSQLLELHVAGKGKYGYLIGASVAQVSDRQEDQQLSTMMVPPTLVNTGVTMVARNSRPASSYKPDNSTINGLTRHSMPASSYKPEEVKECNKAKAAAERYTQGKVALCIGSPNPYVPQASPMPSVSSSIVPPGFAALPTGASNHMTFDPTNLKTRTTPSLTSMANANGQSYPVTGDIRTQEIIGHGTKRWGLYYVDDVCTGEALIAHDSAVDKNK